MNKHPLVDRGHQSSAILCHFIVWSKPIRRATRLKRTMTHKLISISPRAALFIGAALLSNPVLAQDIQSQTAPPPVVIAPSPSPTAAPIEAAPAPAAQPAPVIVLPELEQTSPPAAVQAPKADVRAARVNSFASSPKTSSPTAIAPRTTKANTLEPTPVAELTSPTTPEAPVAPQFVEAPTAPVEAAPDWLLIGGIAGAGLVGAGGAAMVLRRRRRSEDDVEEARDRLPDPVTHMQEPLDLTPAFASPAMAAGAPREGVGRFEAAAERGATADNPFLTRRARVRRARFYDRRERIAMEQGMPAPVPVADAPARSAPQTTYVFGKANPPRMGGLSFGKA